jgi:hypothetical protein
MKRKSTVQPQPIAEQVVGVVTEVDEYALLSPADLAEGRAIARGELTLRYGITYLGKPHLSIVPQLVVADYGELLNGEAAWEFLMTSAHLYPRADICGLRNDGAEDMPPLKELDFDHPYAVFVYRQLQDYHPLAKLAALIDAGARSFPKRLLGHLPRYESLSAWRQNE